MASGTGTATRILALSAPGILLASLIASFGAFTAAEDPAAERAHAPRLAMSAAGTRIAAANGLCTKGSERRMRGNRACLTGKIATD